LAELRKDRTRFLDNIIRNGILTSHAHCPSTPPITSILLSALSTTISLLGLHTTKHLSSILTFLVPVITDPFAATSPEMLLLALGTLRELVLACWKRLRDGAWREVVRGLCVCWDVVTGEEGDGDEGKKEELKRVKKEMRGVGRVLVRALEGGVDVEEELRPLMEVDAGYAEIFGI
jgi:hypothetical protein